MSSKKISFRGWKGHENLPSSISAAMGCGPEIGRELVAMLRKCGFVIGSCTWCFYLKVRGNRARCPVCDTIVHANGMREHPHLVVDGQILEPNQTSRKMGERLLGEVVREYQAIVSKAMLEDDCGPRARPSNIVGPRKKVVN